MARINNRFIRQEISIGTRFGILTVTSNAFYRKPNKPRVFCKCDCGNMVDALESNLKQSHTRSCGCLQKRVMGTRKKEQGESARNALYRNYMAGARRRTLDFKLTPHDFWQLTVQNCHYCGKEPTQVINNQYSGFYQYNGIDRKDNNCGYEIENCVACCKDCNTLKRNMSYYEFIDYLTRIYKHWLEPYIGICVDMEENTIQVYEE